MTSSFRLSPAAFLGAGILALLVSIGFGTFYAFIALKLALTPWIAVLLAHLLIAAMLVTFRRATREALRWKGCPIVAWLPGFFVLVGAGILSTFGDRSVSGYSVSGIQELIYVVSTLTIVPLFEEVVFRCGVSPFFSRVVGARWGVWFAALIFSVVHTNPTWGRVMAMKVGMPIGPFLLAICADIIVRRWGRAMPAVFFHASCNATVYIFASLNPSWLAKLGGLYM